METSSDAPSEVKPSEEKGPADGSATPAEESEEATAPEKAAPAEDAEEATEESEEGGDDEEEEEDEDEDEDDEDEEEEAGDQMDALRKECATRPSILPYVHHYEHCVERVTKAQEDPDYDKLEYKEDCVEEFFHLQHHINDCVVPRLMAKLK